jgi:hypothetical protein
MRDFRNFAGSRLCQRLGADRPRPWLGGVQSVATRKVPAKIDLLYSTFFVEHSFTCPYCGEEISMVLDLSVHRQTYVEDCEVCCNPIEISYTVQDDALASFEAKMLE